MRWYHRALPLFALIGGLYLESCISLPSVGLYRGGAGTPSTEIVGLNGARVRNISFQNIGASAARPVVIPMESGGVAALQLVTPTEYSLARLNDTLGSSWATSFTSPEAKGGLSGLMSLGGLTMPADAPLATTRANGKIGILSSRRLPDDSVQLVARIFDEKSGKLDREAVVYRLKETGEMDPTRATSSAAVSPNGSMVAVWTPVAMNNDRPAKFDVQILGPDLDVRGKGIVSVESEERSERFAGMLVNDAGELFAVTRNESGLVAVTRHQLLGGGAPSRLETKISVPDAYRTALKDIRFGFDGPAMIWAMLGGIDTDHNDNLVGVASARFDFASNTVPTSKFTAIPEKTLEEIFVDDNDFKAAMLQSVQQAPNSDTHVAIFEQRAVREDIPTGISIGGSSKKSDKKYVGLAENVVMLGLDREGNLIWRQGFRKSQRIESSASTDNIIKAMYRDGNADQRANESPLFYPISMSAGVGRDGVLRIVYPDDSKLHLREYRIADGEAVGGGKDREVAKLPSAGLTGGAMVVRPTLTWIGDRAFVVSVFERTGLTGSGDMKLVRVEY